MPDDDGPKEKRQRNRRIDFRLTEAEYAEVRRKADRSGYTVGAYVRATVLGSPGPRAQRLPPTNKHLLLKLLGELGKIGSNINQIARAINSGRVPPIPQIEKAVQALLDMDSLVMRALGLSPDRAADDDGDDR